MRVGKRANVVEAKRTRSCVVRLENISSPPMKAGKITRSGGVSSRAHMQLKADEKKYKGPLKKRPIAHGPIAAALSKGGGTPNTAQTRSKHGGSPNAAQTSKSKFSTPNATQTTSKTGTPNSAQAAKSKSNTPNSAQTTLKSGTPNSAQAAKSKSNTPNSAQTTLKSGTSNSAQSSKFKSGTANPAQISKSKSGTPNSAQAPKSKSVTPNSAQISLKSGTPNTAQLAKSKSGTPNSAQISSKSGTPNTALLAKSKSGTPNSAQISSKSGTPNTALLAKSKSGTPNAAQASAKAGTSKSIQAFASKAKDATKDTFKTPLKATKIEPTKPVATPAPTPPTPTIAAGRSRRAIKPNPKYASEDIVTPKMIRNVATMSGTGGGTTAKKSTNSTAKQRKASMSSLDDFFNRDSNDELDDKDDLEYELDEMYRAIAKDSDSDFSDDSKIVNPRTAKRAKQSQQRKTTFAMPTTKTSATTPRPTPTGSHKSQPTQLQLLRKSFAASLNRSIEPIAGVKRPRNDSVTAASSSDNDGDVSGIARKRLLLTKSSPSNVPSSRDIRNSSSSEITMPMRKTAQQIPNGSKIMKLKTDGTKLIEEPKRNAATRVIERRTLMDGPSATMKTSQQSRFQPIVHSNNDNNNKSNTTATSSTSTTSTTRTLITMPMKTQNARGLSLTKRRSASPAIKKASPKPIREDKPTNESIVENKSTETENLSTTIEDFETMPTFTIVNINDIINKKGDVLISKSDKSLPTDDSDMSDDYDLPESKPTDEYKPVVVPERRKRLPESKPTDEYKPVVVPERRKLVLPSTKKVSDDVRRSKSPLTTTTATTKKLPAQKILNHTLVTKKPSLPTNTNTSANRNKINSSISPDKPAPRILNSVVAKKTQPVKPMIANFEDSENEDTYQFSLDGDDDMDLHDDDDDDDDDDTNVAPRDYNDDDENEDDDDDDDPDDSFNLSKQKLPTSTPYTTKKKASQPPSQAPPTATKENSQTALNRQLTTTKSIEQRKVTPEKVVISRQGDKVIKKITCFETWYVIVPDEVKPSKEVIPRNILEIPLIKLANVATEIKLPNSDWKGKVTLNELSPTMLAKTNLTLFTGDLKEFNIAESERGRYQPSCVMFRRTVNDRTKSRLPYDRAVIFKNRTFFTNIEGKNVKLVGAPSTVQSQKDVEILLQIIDSLTLESILVEPTNTIQ